MSSVVIASLARQVQTLQKRIEQIERTGGRGVEEQDGGMYAPRVVNGDVSTTYTIDDLYKAIVWREWSRADEASAWALVSPGSETGVYGNNRRLFMTKDWIRAHD
jgi:hypothetical protein